ncbi:MAG: hypothetical protein KDB22_02815 [Planctomycetales bacterium]|nr:hypothetical protein [Planctomycetales bacterium]
MSETVLQQFFVHPHRHRYVVGATLLLGGVLGLPAYDEVQRIETRKVEILQQIDEAQKSIGNLGLIERQLSLIKREVDQAQETVGPQTALAIREEVVRLIHTHRCRLLNVQLTDPVLVAWDPDSNPLDSKNAEKNDSNYQLVQSKLSVSTEGTLSRLDGLLADISSLHKLAVPTQLDVRATGDDKLKADFDLTLLDLSQKEGK